MAVLPGLPPVLNGTSPIRTRCGSALTAAFNVDGLNLIQFQAVPSLLAPTSIALLRLTTGANDSPGRPANGHCRFGDPNHVEKRTRRSGSCRSQRRHRAKPRAL